MEVPSRFPVLVGVGVGSRREGDDALGVEAAELMTRAVEAAAEDTGAPDLAAAVEQIAVPQGTWSYPDPGRLVAARIGATGARTVLVDLGIPQQSIVNEALRSILTGTLDVAVVVGGEAKGYEARADHWSEGGLWELRPLKAFAWSVFPDDMTRFRFDRA